MLHIIISRYPSHYKQTITIFSVEHVDADHGICTSVSKADCREIARSRGIQMSTTRETIRPVGCYHKKSSNHMWYNTSPRGVACHANRVCVCEPAAANPTGKL